MVDDRTALMSARALSPGYEILWYTIDRVLGQGGFGITYLAHDRNLDRAVAIKEYLPTTFAYRHEDYSVKPITGDHRENFVWGLGSFLKEAQTLARFSHPNVVRVHSVFEQNNTAYMVMEYEHGDNLATLYKQRENLQQSFFEQMFFPIFDGLKEIHKFDFIHRDIKPANIYIREDGTPVLIDFGSARQTTQQQTSEITTLVSQGYTPLEQYSANYGDQGPWTDIYALAASVYEGIVGKKPEESLSRSACLMRSKPDLLESLDAKSFPGFDQQFLNAVFAGLKLEPEGRPQSLEAWSDIFRNGNGQFPAPLVDTGFGSGFTELETDRTRIQPRKPATQPSLLDDYDSISKLPERVATPESMPVRLQPEDTNTSGISARSHLTSHGENSRTHRPLEADVDRTPRQPSRNDRLSESLIDDELLGFKDHELDMGSRTRPDQRSVATTSEIKSRKKGSGLLVAAAGLAAVLVGGSAYYFLGIGEASQDLSEVALQNMPGPPQSIITTLPKDSVLEQLDNMAELAPLLTQAYSVSPTDADLLVAIQSTESSLLSLAKQWNATQHQDVADKILAVSRALPSQAHDQVRIQGIIDAASQVSANSDVLALLDSEHYLSPEGGSVLDKITTVSASDFQQIGASSQWSEMMSEFSNTAMDKLANAEYNAAARITEAALTMDPEDAGFKALRRFLAGQ